MKIKRIINVLVSLVFITLAISSCTNTVSDNCSNEIIISEQENNNSKVLTEETKTYVSGSRGNDLTLKEIIERSYSIITGTLEKIIDSEEIANLKYYYFSVDECFKGDMDNMDTVILTIYDFEIRPANETGDFYIVGDQYLLPIIKKPKLYSEDVLQLSGSTCAKVNGEKIIEAFQSNKEYSSGFPKNINAFKNEVEKSVSDIKANGKPSGAVYTKSSDIETIIDFSQIIVKVKIIDGSYKEWTDSICTYRLEIIEIFKGELVSGTRFFALQTDDIKEGQEYLLMLSEPLLKEKETYSLSSLYSYVSVSDTEKYAEYMKYIGK